MAGVEQTVQTSFGPVPVYGRFASPDRPLLLVIRGAFPLADHLDWLTDVFTEVDVALVHLPGMHTPFVPEPSIERFAAAFDEVLLVLGHRRVVVLGLSMGGLAAMAMKSPAVAAILLIDTLLTTTSLWPVHSYFVWRALEDEALQDWLIRVCGVVPDGIANRDYSPLLRSVRTPVGLLTGTERLGPPGSATGIPCLLSEEDLTAYRACSWVSVLTIPGAGHDVPTHAPTEFMGALRKLVSVALAA